MQLNSAIGKVQAKDSITLQTKNLSFWALTPQKPYDGHSNPRVTYEFQFDTFISLEVGYQFGGCSDGDSEDSSSRDSCQLNSHHGVVQRQLEESMEIHFPIDGGECKGRLATSD